MYFVKDIEPARVLVFLGTLGDCKCLGLQHRSGRFPSRGRGGEGDQSRPTVPLKTKTPSAAVSLVCRELCDIVKTEKRT